MVFRPVLLSGSNSRPRSRSTHSQLRLRISRSLAPVSIKSLRAAAAYGQISVRRIPSLTRCFAFGFVSSTSHGMPVSKQAYDADQCQWLATGILPTVWANAVHLARGDGQRVRQLQNGEMILVLTRGVLRKIADSLVQRLKA